MSYREAPSRIELPPEPRYGKLAVKDDLILYYDMDDTWVAVKRIVVQDECECTVVGLSEIDLLIERLREIKELLEAN